LSGKNLLVAPLTLKHNGTTIGSVNFTDAAILLNVPVASMGRVPVASQYGAVFAITVREGFITPALTEWK
jgi:hypothetical protein